MQIDSRYGHEWDSQAVAQFNILPYFSPSERTHAEWVLQERLAQTKAGRVAALNHLHVQYKLRELDPHLSLRWEFDHPDGGGMWAIDRWSREFAQYFTICFWSHTLGEGIAIKAILEDGDMQRPDYMTRKKKYQEYSLLRNDKLREDIALAAVDSMSRAQLEQMMQVETALRTGEKIRSYGRDAEILNKMYDNTKKLDAMLHDNVPDSLIEQVVGERIKMLPGDQQFQLPEGV